MTSEQIADEWIKMTFTLPLAKETTVAPNSMSVADFQLSVKNMMLASHQTAVDYMMPLDYTISLPGRITTDRNPGVMFRVHVLIGCQSIITMQMQKELVSTVQQVEVMR